MGYEELNFNIQQALLSGGYGNVINNIYGDGEQPQTFANDKDFGDLSIHDPSADAYYGLSSMQNGGQGLSAIYGGNMVDPLLNYSSGTNLFEYRGGGYNDGALSQWQNARPNGTFLSGVNPGKRAKTPNGPYGWFSFRPAEPLAQTGGSGASASSADNNTESSSQSGKVKWKIETDSKGEPNIIYYIEGKPIKDGKSLNVMDVPEYVSTEAKKALDQWNRTHKKPS